ncbi:ATP-binding cassette domain-containing protein, partial [Paracidovorax anthurii]|uniref:ATP-binding cassette domain-containing protein n=1 Tax=Paracidovorax anthurii TaxID=78229 RepID=UPI0039EFC297
MRPGPIRSIPTRSCWARRAASSWRCAGRSDMAAVLQAEGLAFRSPRGRWLVQDIAVQAGEGECVALVGPNGAGKSTLL